MPGLLGVAGKDLGESSLVEKMRQSVSHKELYRLDRHKEAFFDICRIHLGIYNPEPQPIFNEEGDLCIFMDGKIYGYEREMEGIEGKGHKVSPRNDPAFCIHLYEDLGKDFVRELNGSFVIVICDLKDRAILIANDRYGFRPVYYAHHSNRLLFAPEIKAILQDKTFKKRLDERAVSDFFAFGELLGNKTFFEGISTIPPSSIFTFKGNKVRVEQYWDFEYQEAPGQDEKQLVLQLKEAFRRAVRRRTRNRLRYGVALSGGLDSRSILASLNCNNADVTAFTFGVPHCQDIRIASRVARQANVEHRVFHINPKEMLSYFGDVIKLTEGMDSISVSFLPLVYEKIQGQFDVFLDGLAGDLILGGSFIDRSFSKAKNEEDLLVAMRERIALFSEKMLEKLFKPSYYTRIKDLPLSSLREEFKKGKNRMLANQSDSFFLRNHVRRYTILGSIIGRAYMEEAIPTFDNDFIDVVLKIPPSFRKNHRIYRKLLRSLSAEMSDIPYQKTMIPVNFPLSLWKIGRVLAFVGEKIDTLLGRITMGRYHLFGPRNYVDVDGWLRSNESWKELFDSILLENNALFGDYLNQSYVRELLSEHRKGTRNHSRRLCHILTFELFLRRFFGRKER